MTTTFSSTGAVAKEEGKTRFPSSEGLVEPETAELLSAELLSNPTTEAVGKDEGKTQFPSSKGSAEPESTELLPDARFPSSTESTKVLGQARAK